MSSIVYKIIDNCPIPESITNDSEKFVDIVFPKKTEGVVKIAGVHKTLQNGRIRLLKSTLCDGVHTPILILKKSTHTLASFKRECGLFVFVSPKNEEIWSLWEHIKRLEIALKENVLLTEKLRDKIYSDKIF